MRRIRRRIRVFVPYVWEQDFVRVSMRTSVAPGELGARPSVRIDGRRGIVAGALPKPFGSANITLFVAPLCRESRREFDKGFGQRRTTKGFGSQPVWPLGSGGRDAIPSYMSEVEERYRWRLVTQQPVGLQEQSPVQAGCAAEQAAPRWVTRRHPKPKQPVGLPEIPLHREHHTLCRPSLSLLFVENRGEDSTKGLDKEGRQRGSVHNPSGRWAPGDGMRSRPTRVGSGTGIDGVW